MTTPTEFKRLRFFTGFFTTAADWTAGQQYYLDKMRLHNKGLHTPGIIRGIGQELRVEPVGLADPMSVRVMPGSAIDADGNEIFLGAPRILTITPGPTLPEVVYLSINYAEKVTDYVDNKEAAQYSGHTRVSEVPDLAANTTQPNNRTSIELARIDLQAGVISVESPVDPDNPGGNQIDQRFVLWAGSVGITQPGLTPAQISAITTVMQDKRQDFAALDRRFPVPSASDVRSAALTAEMLSRTDNLKSEHLPNILSIMAAVEQDVEQELGVEYPILTTTGEYQAYQAAIDDLQAALLAGLDNSVLLTRQSRVSEAARQLSEVVIQPPIAGTGQNRTVSATGGQAVVRLDASSSQGFSGRQVVRYRWDRQQRPS